MSARRPARPAVVLYDTTLRDGLQGFGLQLSAEQKVAVARELDGLGVGYVEAGWPGANPRDTEVFARLRREPLNSARLAAFGATRRKGHTAAQDPVLGATLAARTPVLTLVGKASAWQVRQVLGVSLRANLRMVQDSVAFGVAQGREVVFDAEHFFDGSDGDPGYSLEVAECAVRAGASWVVLCDTNGGQLPGAVARLTARARTRLGDRLGIHCHNDTGTAVASSLAALEAGARMVQGTVNGTGERCGNADLLVIAANLQLKCGIPVLEERALARLAEVSRHLDALLNRPPDPSRPYLGEAAFLHKAGLHAQGVARHRDAYQHVDPALVGNRTRTVVSDQSGRSNIASKLRQLELPPVSSEEMARLVRKLKELESSGWAFEDADASFELLVTRTCSGGRRPFSLQESLVVAHETQGLSARVGAGQVQAQVKVRVGTAVVHTAAEGFGPVEALDLALRRALTPHFPELATIELVDYRVRVIDGDRGTGATVRVGIDSWDGQRRWTTVGCSRNILQASALALVDSYEWAVGHAAPQVELCPSA
ncbi:MAG: citramalate synthase [Candidatus Dormibacteria bacterium]